MKKAHNSLQGLVITWIFVLFSQFQLQAGLESRSARGYANQLSYPGTFLQSWDDKYAAGSWISGFVNRSNRCVVELGLDENKHFFHSSYFKVKVTFDVQLTDASQNVTTLTGKQLEITYNPSEQSKYTDKAQLEYYGYYKVKVYNISFQTCGASGGCVAGCIANDVYVQAEVSTDRAYNFLAGSSAFASNQLSCLYQNTNSENELVFAWPYLSGATEYELEYTWVDNYDFNFSSFTSFVRPASSINYDLLHDATRVLTPYNSYRLPLNYERGYIVYRIRPVSRDPNGTRLDGAWSAMPAFGTIQLAQSSAPSCVYQVISPLANDGINWSATSTFAENGRSGRGVSYADATGLVRQSLARLNTENENLVQSSLYDHYGRLRYSMLPAPVPGLDFAYRLNLNMVNVSGSIFNFDKSIYDVQSGGNCNSQPYSLDAGASAGAANYYSALNPRLGRQQGFLPNAKGFPFVENRYLSDNTGRVTSQSMPGGDHWIGSGHETRYYYSHPSQVELDRLFGSEAGSCKLYRKNFIIDANGQTSASYIDGEGRTVASALLGNSPQGIDPIPDNVPAITLTEDMAKSNTVVDTANLCVEVNTSFFVSGPGEQQAFTYSTTLGKFFAAGCSQVQCFDCVYDLEFNIKDECGQDVFYDQDNNALTPPVPVSVSIGANPPYASNCTGPMGAAGTTLIKTTGYNLSATPVTVVFPAAGVYTIYKRICVSNKPVDDYLSVFSNEPVCSGRYCSIADSLMQAIDYSSCAELTCSSCMQSLANFTDVKNGVRVSPEYLDELYGKCKALCNTSTCDKLRTRLCMDFVPGSGVFGDLTNTGAHWAYSIFNPANLLGAGTGLGKTWNNPPFFSTTGTPQYKNNLGAAATVTINGVSYFPHQLSVQQFDSKFQTSWAEALLPLHPEYCKLKFYCDVIGTSLDYEEDMKNLLHYEEACAAGYLKPWPFAFSYGPVCTGNSDPATSFPPMFNSLVNQFSQALASNFNGSGLSIYQVATKEVYGGVIPPNHSFGSDPCTRDEEWKKFLELYRAAKHKLYADMQTLYLQTFNTAGQGACGSMPNGVDSRFPDNSELLADGFNPNWNSQNNGPQLAAAVSANITADCMSTCASYVTLWQTELTNYCPGFATASPYTKSQILAAFEGVCRAGCNQSHPDGSSSAPNPGPGYALPFSGPVVYDFQSVLNYYLSSGNCSSYLVSAPLPYDKSDVAQTSDTKLNDCKCDQLLKVDYDLANNINIPPGVTTGWQLFKARYGFDIAEYNLAVCSCKAALGNNVWAPGHTWLTGELNNLTSLSIAVSPKLSCNSCVKCTDVVSKMNACFSSLPVPATFPNVVDAVKNNFTNAAYVTNYINAQNNWKYTIGDYIDLYEDCQQFNTPGPLQGTFKNFVSQQGIDLYRYLKDLVENKLLSGNRPMKMCTDSKYFLSSLYDGDLPVPPSASYAYATNLSGNTMGITISYQGNPICTINLSLPGSYSGNWSSLTLLKSIAAYVPTPGPGAQYGFRIVAEDGNYQDVTITGSSCYMITTLSSSAPYVPAKCPVKPPKKKSCQAKLIADAIAAAKQIYSNQLESAYTGFVNDYKRGCLSAITETLTRTYQLQEYHYTLYYYDKAGNLQRTVAPKGVAPLGITTSLPANAAVYPNHSSSSQVDYNYVSDYRFSTYNTPLNENTVDGGATQYYYDKFGRLMASQNQKQSNASTSNSFIYSYTIYDDLGRIVEVGEMASAVPLTQTIVETRDSTATTPMTFKKFCRLANKTQVVSTYYDQPTTLAQVLGKFGGSGYQYNLRNRVAFTTYSEIYTGSATQYDHATYFSYDEHGNVKAVVQHNTEVGQRFSPAGSISAGLKKITYDYELVSGNMVRAHYEYGQRDQISHKYVYDDDNRLHEVFTSKDNLNWDRDAKYFYYEHGPLARVERADRQVQGTDYYYTIHGWIKGINSQAMEVNNDVGKDGAATNAYSTANPGLHNFVATDAISYGLNYYHLGIAKDYEAANAALFTSTGNLRNPLSNYSAILSSGSFNLLSYGPDLFNGNISSMVTSFVDKDATGNVHANNTPFPQLAAFKYDQLHRIRQMRCYRELGSNNLWNASNASTFDGSYNMNLSYDVNGNISALSRNGAGPNVSASPSLPMDNLSYKHAVNGVYGTRNTNQLVDIADAATSAYTEDVKAPSTFGGTVRYEYDGVGNLVKDRGEYISNIEWSVDRKIRKITRDAAAMLATGTGPGSVTKPDIEYVYNAQRQRVAKIVKPRLQSTKALAPTKDWTYTYYVYDAGGNLLTTYNRASVPAGGTNPNAYIASLTLGEHQHYGSERLAVSRLLNPPGWTYTFDNCGGSNNECQTNVSAGVVPAARDSSGTARMLGYKEFELSNHLGNVIATVSDRKLQDPVPNTSSCPGYLDMNGSVPAAASAYFSNLSISSGALQVNYTPGNGGSGVMLNFGAVPAGLYLVEFDFDAGTTGTSDAPTVYAYNSVGYYGPYYTCNATGHVSFLYDSNGSSLFSFLTFVNSSNTFRIDNFSMCPANTPALAGSYHPDLLMHADYYAFGQEMPGRRWAAGNYRYGMNGQEKEDEVFKGANSAEYWLYDARVGRRWELDPIVYGWQSPFACFNNSPVYFSDPDGLEGTDWIKNNQTGVSVWDGEIHNIREFNARYGQDGGDFSYQGHWAIRAVDASGKVFNGMNDGTKHYLPGRANKTFEGKQYAPVEKGSVVDILNGLQEKRNLLSAVLTPRPKVLTPPLSNGRLELSISPFDFWSPAKYLKAANVAAVNVYRVQRTGQFLKINENANVVYNSMNGKPKMVYMFIDDFEQALEYAAKKPGSTIITFKVDAKYIETIQKLKHPQHLGLKSICASDATSVGGAARIGIHSNKIEGFLKRQINGSAKIINP